MPPDAMIRKSLVNRGVRDRHDFRVGASHKRKTVCAASPGSCPSRSLGECDAMNRRGFTLMEVMIALARDGARGDIGSISTTCGNGCA